jgi:DNA repair protein RadA/Sms
VTSRVRTAYRCTECGADHFRWQGRCDSCGEWNTLVEEIVAPRSGAAASRSAAKLQAGAGAARIQRIGDVEGSQSTRWSTGIGEFDFVLGGGIVPGSVVLIGGEPGIGKSTLLLQVAAALDSAGRSTLYSSSEESALQIKLRAERIGGGAERIALVSETRLEPILAAASQHAPSVLMVDSIQTVFTDELDGAPGNVGQVRECAARLVRFAKESGTAVFLVGHITKAGGIAGPKTLEHIVDTVLYFEGDASVDHRILRATKNRFGSVDELAVFRMSQEGLTPVANPSELFLGDGDAATSGSAVTAVIEGTRPLLVEIQALAARAGFGTPQRVATGYDSRRLSLLLAVLEKRAGISFAQLDVFLNVAGGVRLQEPSVDLAVAAALASSVYDRAVPSGSLFIGEVGLGGEVRPVSQVERRIGEGVSMGMNTVYVAERAVPRTPIAKARVVGVRTISDLFGRLFG